MMDFEKAKLICALHSLLDRRQCKNSATKPSDLLDALWVVLAENFTIDERNSFGRELAGPIGGIEFEADFEAVRVR